MTNSSLFFISPYVSKVFRVRHGLLHFAEVEMEFSLLSSGVSFALSGTGWVRHGQVEDASDGYESWKAGASAGIDFGLHVLGAKDTGVIVKPISGQDLIDTNPWIVAEAAAKGIWSAADVQPSPELVRRLENFVSESWHFPETPPLISSRC